jgi:membrane protease YdiL (CAAX protease family)
VAPVAEEIFFRGVAYNAWERERGPWVAVLGSAALFAAIHGSLFAAVPIFALGVTLALLYRRTGSLAATIAMHAGFNAISVAIALLVRQGS